MMVAEFMLTDGRRVDERMVGRGFYEGAYGNVWFHSEAQTWKGICRAARRNVREQLSIALGRKVTDADYKLLRVNGNAE